MREAQVESLFGPLSAGRRDVGSVDIKLYDSRDIS